MKYDEANFFKRKEIYLKNSLAFENKIFLEKLPSTNPATRPQRHQFNFELTDKVRRHKMKFILPKYPLYSQKWNNRIIIIREFC